MKTSTLKLFTGFKIGDRFIKDVVIREGIVADTIEADKDNESGTNLELGVRVSAKRIVSAGDLVGPLDASLLLRLREQDYKILDNAINALDAECEAEIHEFLGTAGGRSGTGGAKASAPEHS